MTIDILVDEGYKDAGYEYVIIDDCWAEFDREKVYIDSKDSTNFYYSLVADRKRFPSGIKYLTDYAHKKGMKLGIYADFGNRSCTGYNPGSINNLEADAYTFAQWGVDYVKMDGCFAQPEDMDVGYPMFGYFLNKTNRAMIYSCSWPYYQRYIGIEPNYRYIAKHCNLWRNYWDIRDDWNLIKDIISYYAYKQESLISSASPGAWNDPDQVMVGAPGLSFEQSKAHMAIWAILAAPLIMSNDLTRIPHRIKHEILLNKRLIAINQDPLGKQGRLLFQKNLVQVWIRPILPRGSYALALLYPFQDEFAVNNDIITGPSENGDGLIPKMHNFDLQPILLGLNNESGYVFYNVYDITGKDKWVMQPNNHKMLKISKPGVVFLQVIDHYENPRNVGSLDKSEKNVGTGLVGAPACGDVMKLQIKVDENGKIVDAKFKTFGCGSAIASSSLATEWIKGKSVNEAGTIKNSDIAKELCLPPVKLHCSMLAEDAIRAALLDYKKKQEK
ncbi:unnamed protein product [Gordionus sp. m RMFG-2023]